MNMNGLDEVLKHALMITSFVFMMMVVVEYLNVLTRGSCQERLTGRRWGQYLLAASLGATPGCLGAFAVVAMYSHGVVSLGAVVAAMIATSGDESFVMLAMMPKQALLVFGVLFILGIASGPVTDAIIQGHTSHQSADRHAFEVHHDELCNCFPRGRDLLHQWQECTAARGILSVVLAAFAFALVAGWLGPAEWNWMRVTLFATSMVALFIVSTVSDHFLHEHLWDHVARRHVPRVFLWTLGALVVMYVLTKRLDLEGVLRRDKWAVLLVACLVGLIPESGPHLIFVILYTQGSVPFSVLLASSIVQDGHGMLPVLAESRQAFVQIKAINFIVGALCGALAMACGC